MLNMALEQLQLEFLSLRIKSIIMHGYQHKSTLANTNQHKSTRVNTNPKRINTNQLDQHIIIVYRSLVGKVR